MEDMTLATELLHELKNTTKRWFIAFLVMVALECATVIGFVWYITLPVEEYFVEQEATDRSFNVINGGGSYGSETEDILQETSSENP